MTHPHADHIGGMPEVLEAFPVERFLLPDFSLMDELPTSAVFQRTLEALEKQKENGCEVLTAARGQEIRSARGRCGYCSPGSRTDNTNNLSVCAKFTAGKFSCLFTGDGEEAVEQELLAVEPNLGANVFQAGHQRQQYQQQREAAQGGSPRGGGDLLRAGQQLRSSQPGGAGSLCRGRGDGLPHRSAGQRHHPPVGGREFYGSDRKECGGIGEHCSGISTGSRTGSRYCSRRRERAGRCGRFTARRRAGGGLGPSCGRDLPARCDRDRKAPPPDPRAARGSAELTAGEAILKNL